MCVLLLLYVCKNYKNKYVHVLFQQKMKKLKHSSCFEKFRKLPFGQ